MVNVALACVIVAVVVAGPFGRVAVFAALIPRGVGGPFPGQITVEWVGVERRVPIV